MLGMRLQDLDVNMTSSSQATLWEMASLAAALIFVEGFSEAKRCSNEGRALMQLDYRQFVLKLEKICQIKPLPHQDHVIQYVKAYYIPEAELESWVKYHPVSASESQLLFILQMV